MAKEKPKTVVPKLRFPEFRGAGGWNVDRMDTLYSFMRNNTLSRDKLNYECGVAKNIHYGDIHTKFSTLFDISNELVPFINDSENIPDASSEDYCLEGDLIIADASEDTNDVGKCIEVFRLNGQFLLAGQHTILARRKSEKIARGFGGHLFCSRRIRSQIQKESQGTKVYQISPTRLARIEIAYPMDQKEQEKVADCLTSLDELITAQGRKVEALKTYKRGLMQQIFPREGETVPRLRFQEFRNAPGWKKSILGSVCKMQAGKFVEASAISEARESGRFPCYGGNGLRGFTKTYTHSGRYPLIGRQGALCGNVKFAEGEFHATEHAIVSTPNDGISVDWLFCALGYLQLNQFATGQAQPGLSVEVLEKVELKVPISEHEQQRVADCLSSIDSRISLENNTLSELKRHKQALMQQLFPSVEDAK